jgi:hypothetical protein
MGTRRTLNSGGSTRIGAAAVAVFTMAVLAGGAPARYNG